MKRGAYEPDGDNWWIRKHGGLHMGTDSADSNSSRFYFARNNAAEAYDGRVFISA